MGDALDMRRPGAVRTTFQAGTIDFCGSLIRISRD
jgi:hypothetical protein